MLRRLSDVTIGSLEKFLNINGNNNGNKKRSEKKRKFYGSEFEEDNEERENVVDKENHGSRLRKSKGHWDLSTDPPASHSSSRDFSSSDVESIKIDLEGIDSSEIPTDLSINEEEWTDYLITEQLTDWDNCTILKDSDNIEFDEVIYWNDIYKSMKFREQRGKVLSKAGLLSGHPDLTFVMRAKLINWLFEVAVHYKLQRETIYSTQILLDTFLTSTQNKPRTKLQLIGLSCLLISSKLEEVRPPNLSDLSMICDEMFGKKEIATMELEICSTLKWFLTPINCLTWLRFYENNFKRLKEGNVSKITRSRSYDDIQNSRMIHDMFDKIERKLDFLIHSSRILDFSSSKLTAALLYESLEGSMGSLDLIKCTGYEITELQDELNWIDSWNDGDKTESGSIAYVDPKRLKLLTDDQFDRLIQNHRRGLTFILKKMKLE